MLDLCVALRPASLVHHAPQVIRLGRVSSLSYALLHLVGAVVADLRVALLEIPSIAVVITIELLIVRMVRVVGQVLRQGCRKQSLILYTFFAEDDVRPNSGGWLGFGVLRRRGFSLSRDWRVGNVAILEICRIAREAEKIGYRAVKLEARLLAAVEAAEVLGPSYAAHGIYRARRINKTNRKSGFPPVHKKLRSKQNKTQGNAAARMILMNVKLLVTGKKFCPERSANNGFRDQASCPGALTRKTTRPPDVNRFLHLLPATRRTRKREDPPGGDIVIPSANIAEFLKGELLVPRLDDAKPWLWLCGRPMPPRPLHHQLALRREIIITEDPGLHLVWSPGRIFLKPVPEWLLCAAFFAEHVTGELAPRARGFLFTYCALVANKSDFRIAIDKGLLPPDMEWSDWKARAGDIATNHDARQVSPRYWYGELRLDRLNKVFKYRLGQLRGYSSIDGPSLYMDMFYDNFAILAAALTYTIVVLTAMQVGLGVDRLKSDSVFQNASYGFTIFSIISPLAGALAAVLLAVPIFCNNWIETKRYRTDRLELDFAEGGVEILGDKGCWRDAGS
ncbi:hypothetical protein NLG97_g8829 [Lecanicillium saksenae]|uniref:Uncharacterized protein n=1 Tax=Lecanicillium saksenae TaxID=468837 RepID=A0ACC1QJ05_9HYPO|nr:hypothetical protein NLG97_g8829 [Lecanicillium saksenae]